MTARPEQRHPLYQKAGEHYGEKQIKKKVEEVLEEEEGNEHSLHVSWFYYCNLFVGSRNINGTPALCQERCSMVRM